MLITLINSPGLKVFSGLQMQTPNPNLGLAYITAAVKEAGFQCHTIDGVGEGFDIIRPYDESNNAVVVQGLPLDDIVDRIPDSSRVVGMSCLFSSLWPLVRELAKKVRARYPEILLVLGGEHGTAVPENVLATSPFDVVVLGEGEETFVNLLEAVHQGNAFKDILGIAFTDRGSTVNNGLSRRRRDIDDLPLPDWGSWPIEKYIDHGQINGVNLGRSMPILATRGCPYACTFCSNPQMWTRRWIARDYKKLVDEMEFYISEYKVTNFDFQDLTFVVNRNWTIAFCREILDRGLKITWQMPSGTRAEAFNEEVAKLLYRSGCRVLAFAPESGSVEVLKKIKKQVDLDKLKEAVLTTVKEGLKVSCFFVIGFPEDTPQTLRETTRAIRQFALLGVHDIAVSQFVPYPGSELFKGLQQKGRIQLDDEFFESPMNFYTSKAKCYSDHITSRQLYRTMLWMFLNFYIISFARRPFRMIFIVIKAFITGVEETRFAKWARDRIFIRFRWRQLEKRI